jgi:hypothetical protein
VDRGNNIWCGLLGCCSKVEIKYVEKNYIKSIDNIDKTNIGCFCLDSSSIRGAGMKEFYQPTTGVDTDRLRLRLIRAWQQFRFSAKGADQDYWYRRCMELRSALEEANSGHTHPTVSPE